MHPDLHRFAPPGTAPLADTPAMRFLENAARLLLGYNMRSDLLERRILRIAEKLELDVDVLVSYRSITLFTGAGWHVHIKVHELRINVAVSTRAIQAIDAFCDGQIGLDEALLLLESAEHNARGHTRAQLAVIFGLAAAALAWLLHADWGAMAVSGVSSSIGLLVRQELAKRHVLLFALPFTAALIGAFCGGLAILAGWTRTPGYCLMVPALMLVPGPHLINGLYDMLENHMQTGIARLGLAAGILTSASLGVFLGGWLTLGMTTAAAVPSDVAPLNLVIDVLLAGMASCGFGAFYNAPWRVLWISILAGMIGHGIRYVCMNHGVSQEIATLFACFAIGAISNVAVEKLRLPFAAVAFAGAVPMMPGVFIYQGIGNAMQLSKAGIHADPALAVATLAYFAKACFVIGAMGLGLLLGARLAGLVSAQIARVRRRAPGLA